MMDNVPRVQSTRPSVLATARMSHRTFVLAATAAVLIVPLHLAAQSPPASGTASASSAKPPPAATTAPLPYVAVVPLAAVGKLKPAQAHVGGLLAAAIESAALQSPALNIVSQGVQAEVIEDVGRKPGESLAEPDARRLAQLTGASHVVFGTLEAAEGNKLTAKVRTFGVLAGAAKDLVTVTGAPDELVTHVAEALAKELDVPALAKTVLPRTPKAQKGFVTCWLWASVALERVAVKGRAAKLPKNVRAACKDAASDRTFAPAQGAKLAVEVLGGQKKSVAALDKYLAANATDRTGGLALIRWAFEAEKYDQAEKVLTQLKQARPRDPDVLRLTGELETQKDNWSTARVAFQDAVNQAPNSPYLRYLLSYAAYRTDDPKEALGHARDALRLSGGAAPFYQLNLGERLLDAGQYEEAAKQLQASAKATPTRMTPQVRLGYALLKQGNADGALEVLTAAKKLKPSAREKQRGVDMLLLLDLARAHAAKGNTKEALGELRALKKKGALEPLDLQGTEFDGLRDNAAFKKLAR